MRGESIETKLRLAKHWVRICRRFHRFREQFRRAGAACVYRLPIRGESMRGESVPTKLGLSESFAENPPEISSISGTSISGTSISGTSILGTTSTWLPPSYPRRKHARRKRPKLGLSESFAENPPEISSISGTISARGYRLPIRGESSRGEIVPTKLGLRNRSLRIRPRFRRFRAQFRRAATASLSEERAFEERASQPN